MRVRSPRFLLPLATLLGALAACTPEPPDEEKILADAGDLPVPLPGLYRSTTTLTDYDLPQASPQQAAAMRERMGGVEPSVTELCLSEAEAAQGWVAMIQAMNEGDCRIERFAADGGQLDAAIACTAPGGTTSSMTMVGTAGTTSSSMDMHITQQGPAIPGGEQVIAMTVASERIGDCPAPTPAPSFAEPDAGG